MACMPTEIEMQYGKKDPGAMGTPSTYTMPLASAAVRASAARYGPRNTVPTVVLKALMAQSYMAQPKISRLSLMRGAASANMSASFLLQLIKWERGPRPAALVE